VGKDIESQMKNTVPLILANYTDQKQTMRDTVAKTLDQWAAEVGADAFVPFFPAAVAIESSSARKDALAWLVAHKQDLGMTSDTLTRLQVGLTTLSSSRQKGRHASTAQAGGRRAAGQDQGGPRPGGRAPDGPLCARRR
jgi:siderophore synthetase component